VAGIAWKITASRKRKKKRKGIEESRKGGVEKKN